MSDWQPIPDETPFDPSGLLDQAIRNREQLNVAEGLNIAAASYKYLIGDLTKADAPFDFVWMLSLHAEMFGQVWEWAGATRKVDLNLGKPWQQVEMDLYNLSRNVEFWTEMPVVEQAARLHHGAVSIHPFLNGNGRWSRLLANIWLKLRGSPITVWPEQAVGTTSVIRGEYIAAMKSADAMDLAPLIALHERYSFTKQSLDE